MSRNGSGTYTLPAGNPVVTGTTITSTWANSTLSDIATALTGSVAADGQTPMSGNLNMATNKVTSLGTPTLSTDAATKGYVDGIDATKASSGANSDITSLSGLTTPLSAAQGGTGVTSLPSGSLVGTTATQTLTNKTLTSPVLTTATTSGAFTLGGALDETVYEVVDGAGVAISPSNGTIQTWTLGASRTPTSGTWNSGESLTLMIADGIAYTITWTTLGVTWVNGAAPALATSGYTVVELWKVGSTIYGAIVGDVA